MLKTSTNADDFQHLSCAVAVMEKRFPDGASVAAHSHIRSQLVYATCGVMRVCATGKTWVVPTGQAMWIPPQVRHALDMVGAVHMRTLYVDAQSSRQLGGECRVIVVSRLLRELIGGALDDTLDERPGSRADLICKLILEELKAAPVAAICIAMPQDARLVKICQFLLKHPGSTDSIEIWGPRVGASARTLARRFRAETGLTFVEWRQQVRLADAVGRLASGQSVKQIAACLGYSSASAFISMFRLSLGASPKHFAALAR